MKGIPLIFLKSFLKYSNNAKTLAICTIADREDPGSCKPKNSENTL